MSFTVQRGCVEWKWTLNTPINQDCIHFYQCNEHINITNEGERGENTYWHSENSPDVKCSDHGCTNARAIWLGYKDMKQRTSSWCARHNENKMFIWIFHGGNRCDNCLRVHFFQPPYIIQRERRLETRSLFLRFNPEKKKGRVWWKSAYKTVI